jgi:polyisoprenoid-binding protein YceI
MKWKIDPSHTQIGFVVRHMMIAKVRGRFDSYNGTFRLNAKNLAASQVEGTVEGDIRAHLLTVGESATIKG